MGTRFFLLFATLVGLSAAASAQTSNTTDNNRFVIPATYALVEFDSVVVTVASPPAVPATPLATTGSASGIASPAVVLDGGDGISDAPGAGWISAIPDTKIR